VAWPRPYHFREVRDNPLGFFARMAALHGDMVWLPLGKLWLVSHPDTIEQMLVGERDGFVKDKITRSLSSVLGQGLLTAEGETWRRDRKLCAPSFQPRHLAVYGQAMVDAALAHLPAEGERDIARDMTELTLDIVLRTLFGTRSADASTGRVGPVLDELMVAFEQEQRTLWRFTPDWLPAPHRRRAARHTAELHQIVLSVIAERRQRPAGDDLLWRLLEARDEDGRGMDDAQIRDEALTLFLAGHETTALALAYALWLLALHPAVQDAVRAEANALGRDPTAADLGRLPYTAAVVKEVLRLYPPAYGFGRETVVPMEIGGQQIEAGEHLVALTWLVHRDPRWWRAPEQFRPERWLGDETKDLPRFAYVPFGGGPRVCIGNHFATMEAIVVLATIARRRRLHPVPGYSPDLLPAVTLRSRNGVWVKVEAM
jgi:cytochrome P450